MKGEFSIGYARLENCVKEFSHPYFYWYYFEIWTLDCAISKHKLWMLSDNWILSLREFYLLFHANCKFWQVTYSVPRFLFTFCVNMKKFWNAIILESCVTYNEFAFSWGNKGGCSHLCVAWKYIVKNGNYYTKNVCPHCGSLSCSFFEDMLPDIHIVCQI